MHGYGNNITLLQIATVNKCCYNNKTNKTTTADKSSLEHK